MHKRIILVGPTASGKTFIREKFRQRGFSIDVSYTTRNPRQGEQNGVDYNFISREDFQDMVMLNKFYEWVQYGDNFYGTGLDEWNTDDVFIMETDGIKHIKPEDRFNCVIIYVNTPENIRVRRMGNRGWSNNIIQERIITDEKKFKNFDDYDFMIASTDLKFIF